MKEKLQQLMKSEGLTSSRMAEILGIQPSGISHILAGRNKPGFDLLQKILRRFPRVNPDWLLLDSEQMYRTGNPKSSSSTNGTDAGNGRTERLGKQKYPQPQRRYETTCRYCPRAGHGTQGIADGRTFWRTRRADPRQVARRVAGDRRSHP